MLVPPLPPPIPLAAAAPPKSDPAPALFPAVTAAPLNHFLAPLKRDLLLRLVTIHQDIPKIYLKSFKKAHLFLFLKLFKIYC